MQIAALSASSDRAPQLFDSAARFTDKQTDARATFLHQVSAVIGTRRKSAEIRHVLVTLLGSSKAGSSWWRAASLDGLAQGLSGSGQLFTGRVSGDSRSRANLGQDLVLQLFETSDAEVRHASLRVLAATGLPSNAAPLLLWAAVTAQKGDQEPALRADSIGLLTFGDPAAHEALFKKLIDPQQPEPVQAAAVRGLGRVKGAAIGTYLIERWKSMTPPVRMEAADGMFLDPERPKLLLEAIKTGTVQPWTLAFRHKRQLLMSPDASLREAARSLLEEKAGEREIVLKRYEAALEKDGDPERGRVVFERVCARCHKLNGLGHEVGPDLATIRNRPPQLILPDIIMPSRSIAQNYESYVVETRSRGIIEGVMGSQTPTTITIRHEGGVEDLIRRDDIKEMRITNLSAMPADLDRQITIDQMADLLKFLKTVK
jgi:putative heme-binding domain-containing protein